MACSNFGNNVDTSDSQCFTCSEGMFLGRDECVDCDGARRCVDNTAHLLCADNALLVGTQCAPPTEQNALLITNNHVVKCAESEFADGEACTACPPSCLSCNEASCEVCASGTTLSQDDMCATMENATAQTHNGVVACADESFATNNVCASCADRFTGVCPLCTRCDGGRCVRCDGDVVFEDGAWRASQHCAAADGTVCLECVDGATPFNATDCVPDGDCSAYVDGRCVVCVTPRVLFSDGSCVEFEDCTGFNGVGCLRCVPGMVADEDVGCKRLDHSFQLTCSV